MNALWNSALGLLVVTGALLGLSLPFGKIATETGVPPVVWAFVISAGGGGVILVAMLLRGERISLTARKLRYFFVTAAISYALPNLLLFSVMPHVGAGYAGIMFTLSPIVTLVLSILFGVRRPNLLGILGIAVGFVGAVMVATTRGEVGEPAALFWVAVALLIPLSLASGNIYRTVDWPEDAAPMELAVGSNLAAGLILLVGIALLPGLSAVGTAGRRAAGRRRADRVVRADVRLLLSPAGCRRAGLSQPDRLCGRRDRPVLRHAVPRRALRPAHLAGRGGHRRRRGRDDEGAGEVASAGAQAGAFSASSM